jgi:predicted small lipoprotein YifL
MIRKITLALILCCLIISCGKKGDPKYVDPKKKAKNQIIFLNKV